MKSNAPKPKPSPGNGKTPGNTASEANSGNEGSGNQGGNNSGKPLSPTAGKPAS
jgi:hypothetical protein